MLRDASGHPSPNSGIPESAVAGALGVRLGGLNYYNGCGSFRAYMGKDLMPLEPFHIRQAVRLMFLASVHRSFNRVLFIFYLILRSIIAGMMLRIGQLSWKGMNIFLEKFFICPAAFDQAAVPASVF